MPASLEINIPYIMGVPRNTSVNGFTNYVNASDRGYMYTVVPPETKTCTGVIYRVLDRNGAPSADVRIETISTSDAKPTGTLAWTNATATVAIGNDLTINTVTLTASGTWNAGVPLAVVFAPPSSGTTPDFSNVYNLNQGYNNSVMDAIHPSNVGAANSGLTTSGGRSNFTLNQVTMPIIAITYDDGTAYAPNYGLWRTSEKVIGIVGNTYKGVKVTLDHDFEMVGLEMFLNRSGSMTDFTLRVFDDTNTEIATKSYNFLDILISGYNKCFFPFASSVSLEGGRAYRIVVSGTGANTFEIFYGETIDSRCLPFGGNYHLCTTTNAGSTWDDTNTTLMPLFQLRGYISASAPASTEHSHVFCM
jgi:hypothetical protein